MEGNKDMWDVDTDQIREAFGEVTYKRGWGYFENGHVEMAVKLGKKLIGTVFGTAPSPYRVRVEIGDEIHSQCSCPVGVMCKHGVAVILQWINKKDSITDADQFMASLHMKNKEELVNIIGSLIEDDPFLIFSLMSCEKLGERKIDLEAVSRRIEYAGYEYLEYYWSPGMIDGLYKVKKTADTFKMGENLKDAVEVYLLLIEKGLDLYGMVEDDSGELADLIMECIEDCSHSIELLSEEEKLPYIPRIISVVREEGYGLEAEKMLFALATRDNIKVIEEQIQQKFPESSYIRSKFLDILYHLYRKLGLHDESIIAILKMRLKDKDDYLRITEALMARSRDEEAFKYVKQGLRLEGKGNHQLDKLFFSLLNRLPPERWGDLGEEEIKKTALKILSYHWDIENNYPPIKNVYMKMGKYDELLSTIKTEYRDDVAVSLLLYDDHVDDAIKKVKISDSLYPALIIEVAEAAKDKGDNTSAMDLTIKAIKQGIIGVDETFVELVKLMVEEADDSELQEILDYVGNVSMAKIIAINLLERNQEYAYRLLGRFLADLQKAEIRVYAHKFNQEYAVGICKSWISQRVNRSHVYYDDALDIMELLSEKMDEEEFHSYIHDLMAAHKGKRKLLEKIRIKYKEIL